LEPGTTSGRSDRTETRAEWGSFIDEYGKPALKIWSFGSSQRKNQGVSSQNLQFDREAAAALKAAIEKTFPGI